MKQTFRAAATAIIVGAIVLGAPLAAEAQTTKKVGGGTWTYGVYEPASTTFVFSKYDHSSKTHKSTACWKEKCAYSGWVSKGKRASAERQGGLSDHTAYWDTK
jgi:lactococcin 972 family bacteriocin